MLFELANLKTQLAQKADKADLDALDARVHVLECRNENMSGVDGPRVDTKGDGSSLVHIVREEISERADIESRKLNLVVSGLSEPSTSETTGNINTNDGDTQAVSRLFQTALNLNPYINKTIRQRSLPTRGGTVRRHTIACKSRSTIILTVCCSSQRVFCLWSVRSG